MLYLWFILVSRIWGCFSGDANQTCVSLHFPSLNGSNILTASENTTISLAATIVYTCEDKPSFFLTVNIDDSSLQKQLCLLYHEEGVCQNPSEQCSCFGNGSYVFKYTPTRSEQNTTWTWEMGAEYKKRINVLYPASVSSVVLNSTLHQLHQPTDQGQQVDVICSWDPGNPPVTARLLDRHGVEMNSTINSSEQIRYRFSAVGCQDAGLIRCEAPGASHNKTATLLVRCPPNFEEGNVNRTAENPGRADLSFRFRAHNTASSGCLIIKDVGSLPSDSPGSSGHANDKLHFLSTTYNAAVYNCTGNVFITGTPPDLTLTVRLDNVRKEEEGQWRLELTNDAGTGHVDFYLHVNGSFDAKEMGAFPVVTVVIAAGVAFAVGVGMCAVIFFFHRLCQGTQRHDQQTEKSNQRTAHAEPEDKEDELVMIDNVVYSGRRALPSPPYEEIAACPPPPTVKCSVEVKGAAEGDYAEVELD